MPKKIIEMFGVTNQTDREIGIEIEMEGTNLHINCPGWLEAHDGSLRGESAEYVLRRPIKQKDVDKYLDRLTKALKDNGAVLIPSDRCGVHIHINCQQMTQEEVFKYALLYFVVEDLLTKWCGETREGNLFCLRAKDAEALVMFLTEAIQRDNIALLTGKDIRYAAINFTSLAKYGSLEFRALETPKDFSVIKKWIELLINIRDASKHYKELHQIIEDISLKGPRGFLKAIFKDNAELLYCPRMEKTMIDSARRIQDAAYAVRFKKKVIPGNEPLPNWFEDTLINMRLWCQDRDREFLYYAPDAQRLYCRFPVNEMGIAPIAAIAWGINNVEDIPENYYNYEYKEELDNQIAAQAAVIKRFQVERRRAAEINAFADRTILRQIDDAIENEGDA